MPVILNAGSHAGWGLCPGPPGAPGQSTSCECSYVQPSPSSAAAMCGGRTHRKTHQLPGLISLCLCGLDSHPQLQRAGVGHCRVQVAFSASQSSSAYSIWERQPLQGTCQQAPQPSGQREPAHVSLLTHCCSSPNKGVCPL